MQEPFSQSDIDDILWSDICIDADIQPDQVLHVTIGSNEARKIDQRLDMLDAVSLAFLLNKNSYSTFRLCKGLESSCKNKIVINGDQGLKQEEGLVYVHWMSSQHNNDKYWQSRLSEALYHTMNFDILHEFGLKLEDAKRLFSSGSSKFLDQNTVDLFLICRELCENEREDLIRKAGLNQNYKLLETQILDQIIQKRKQTVEYAEELRSHLPPHLTQLLTTKPTESSVVGQRVNQFPKGPGYVIIINQKKFYKDESHRRAKKLDMRHGTDVDRDRLELTFTYLGAKKIVIFNDLNTAQVDQKLEESASELRETGSQYAWLGVCYLSHGGRNDKSEDEVYACDGIPQTRDNIRDKFATKNLIPSMDGKPKIFVFQACRTPEQEQAQQTSPTKPTASPGPADSEVKTDSAYPQINVVEYIVCSSTVPGFSAFRSTETGSFYIKELCEELLQEGHHEEILTLLTGTNRRLKEKYPQKFPSVPVFESVLTKKFYFDRTPDSMTEAALLIFRNVDFRENYKQFLTEMSSQS